MKTLPGILWMVNGCDIIMTGSRLVLMLLSHRRVFCTGLVTVTLHTLDNDQTQVVSAECFTQIAWHSVSPSCSPLSSLIFPQYRSLHCHVLSPLPSLPVQQQQGWSQDNSGTTNSGICQQCSVLAALHSLAALSSLAVISERTHNLIINKTLFIFHSPVM